MSKREPAGCQPGLEAAMDILVGKWKPIILLHLLQGERKRFSELQRLIPNITQKMLTAQLRELEEQDIVKRVVYPVVPPRVEYSITEYGLTLDYILKPMHDWGRAHLKHMQEKKSQLVEEVRVE
ncbi:transcriptional regulator [Xylanibacillus composti]|uniref:MarR family transcriptional regulator n=1 Tax=Xylanibacillus composti TaxID=1572762 RepID=A0A8J4H3P4_9BACL|nr:helix-turn-helix domain-containing protein [Xylanibacillus composti]MDT9724839.1 transcriptional regulator [Xylanibacillus composti]GIQ69070.1 MarR family transcriptional regulator [Xylanibacillus composti]